MFSNKTNISVIMPTYNSEHTIEEAINSVINQSHRNLELIIVNDCSTDNTINIVEKYKVIDKRIILINNKKNLGISQSRNLAISFATGRYLAFLDSDDVWFSNKLELQISFMRFNNYKFTCTSYLPFKVSDSNIIKNQKVIKAENIMTFRKYLFTTNIGNSSVIIDRLNLNNFNIEPGFLEDVRTWLKILKSEKCYGINIPLMRYRISNNSNSSNKIKNTFRYYKILREYLHYNFFVSLIIITIKSITSVFKRI